MLLGRYRGYGEIDLELEGDVHNDRITYAYDNLDFRRSGGDSFIPRLWATRKIGALLNHIRLKGPDEETVDQVVRLSIRYGIVTPYTSYLVTEPSAIGANVQDDIVADALEGFMQAPMAVTGEEAVGRAAAEAEISKAEVAPALTNEQAELVRFAGPRTFRWVDGIWIDTAYDPNEFKTESVPFLSDVYFELAGSSADIAAGLSLGDRVILVADGRAYEVVSSDEPIGSIQLPDPVGEMLDDDEPIPNPELEPMDPSPGVGRGFNCPGFALFLGMLVLPGGVALLIKNKMD
jgi:Ca-activated chloride channel family protein